VETVSGELAVHKPGKYLTFRVGRRDFVIGTDWVRGILPVHQIIAVETNRYANHLRICGFASLGTRDFPVIDLRAKLDIPHGSRGKEPFIVVVETDAMRKGGRWAGFVADRVSEVLDLRQKDFRNGAVRTHGRPRRILAPDQIMSEKDWSAFANQ
jgi:chemotaxis signal transduction protein